TREETKYLKAIEQLIRKTIPWHGNAPAEAAAGQSHPVRQGRPPRKTAAPAAKAKHAKPPTARPERSPRSERPVRQHALPDAPDASGFNKANMPAFLARPVRGA